ncbi:MAG: oxidoreductase [Balneolaceae bacterium]
MSENICVGIVGYGSSAKIFHFPIIQSVKGLQIKKVVQRSGSEARDNHPNIEIVQDLKDLLKDDLIDLVVITTPNAIHFDQARLALLADKHVIIEKPMTLSAKEADALIDLAKKRDLVLTTYQNRRWDGDFLTLKKVIKSGKLGKHVEFISNFNRFRNFQREGAWKEEDVPGSGILYDLSPHLIDQALQLFGTPNTVYADIRKQREGSVTNDYFRIDFDYGDFTATLNAGMLVPEESPRYILRGTEGSYVKYGMDPQENTLKSGKNPLSENWGVEEKENWGKLHLFKDGEIYTEIVETEVGGYENFYKNIVDAVSKNGELAVKPEQGREVIRMIELSQESDRLGKKVSV